MAANRPVPQLVGDEQARVAADRTGLTAEQRDAVVMMLTAAAATTVLVAPAGAGKSHTMAEFARLWTTFTGRRVIGLPPPPTPPGSWPTRAWPRRYNIAEFLGKTEGSDELRRPVPAAPGRRARPGRGQPARHRRPGHVQEAARQAGARIIATGDTAQLGAVEAGGMFRLLAQEVPAAQPARGPPVRRGLGARSSVRLRDGDLTAAAAYDRHGRIRGADEEAAYDRAASMWLADHLRGKDVLLLAGSNAEAAELSRRVQAKLTQMGSVGPPQAPLADGNHAGVGDLVRARLNTEIDADGRAAHQPGHADSHRLPRASTPRCGGSAWTGPGPGRSGCPGPTSPATPSSPTPATCTSPRAAPSTPPTSWSPSRCPGRRCTSA